MHPNTRDLTGQRFGYLTVLSIHPERFGPNKRIKWLCLCVCGKRKIVDAANLTWGRTRSCGCKKGHLRSLVDRRMKNGPASNYTYLFSVYECSARRRDMPFTISFQQFKTLLQQECHYCGIEPLQLTDFYPDTPLLHNGLDRKDNNKGYTLDNTVPCCWTCNSAKRDRSYEEYHDWIARSARHIFIENKGQRGH